MWQLLLGFLKYKIKHSIDYLKKINKKFDWDCSTLFDALHISNFDPEIKRNHTQMAEETFHTTQKMIIPSDITEIPAEIPPIYQVIPPRYQQRYHRFTK